MVDKIVSQLNPPERLHPRRCGTCCHWDPPVGMGLGTCTHELPVLIASPGPVGQISASGVQPPMPSTGRCGNWEAGSAETGDH